MLAGSHCGSSKVSGPGPETGMVSFTLTIRRTVSVASTSSRIVPAVQGMSRACGTVSTTGSACGSERSGASGVWATVGGGEKGGGNQGNREAAAHRLLRGGQFPNMPSRRPLVQTAIRVIAPVPQAAPASGRPGCAVDSSAQQQVARDAAALASPAEAAAQPARRDDRLVGAGNCPTAALRRANSRAQFSAERSIRKFMAMTSCPGARCPARYIAPALA